MMLSLKKVYRDELLQIAILLSLLRVEPNEWSARVPAIGVGGPDAWEYSPQDIRVHPKSLLVDDQQVLSELSSLGRYNRVANLWQNVTAYMGLTNNDDEVASTSRGDLGEPSPDWGYLEENHDDDLLTPEDMDLIEVLWKQDVDMGFSIQEWQESASAAEDDTNPLKDDSSALLSKKEKLALAPDKLNIKEKKTKKEEDEEEKEEKDDKDQLNGVSYTVDLETGEYIVKEETDRRDDLSEDEPPSSLLPEPEFSLEEALQLVGLNDDLQFLEGGGIEREESEASVSESSGSPTRLTEELDLLEEMIHGPAYPPPHHRPIQGRMGYMRGGSMEQRWQDLASLLSLPEPHYLSGYPPQEHKPTAGLPMPHQEHHAVTPYSPMGSGNVGSAVASSMNLMTNASEPMGSEAGVTAFKMESTHDMMYYQNGTSEINHNSDGFLSSILNDDDLQLMDMAMNEAAAPGMYTMRMLEGASGGGGGDSDSAVSSMGSERVPSLSSDNEWMETNSDSGQAAGDHYQEYSRSKYRWYDYGYGRQLSGEASSLNHSRGQPPVAQKKHHMYGKRIFHDQAAGVRSTPSQIAAHNHTYHMLPEDCGSQQRPLARDKKGRKSEEETHLTRDERRARALNIPIPVEDIINLPMDEFNERLSKYDLSETQLSLIRDIRRRGKNKVAAQNCRKRKLDQILSLADEVKQMRERKQRLLHERQVLLSERHRMKGKFSQLYRHIFQSLRDPEGNPYSPYEWTLQQSTDGSVVLVPQNNRTLSGNQTMLDQTDTPARKPHNP
nr:segmentation protein cap'n'collar isoform X3 [Halyomorpha halys]